tara:strand:- start:91 stop:1050 length:960 start_codon:yes stop_codon:yes gene_type:complete
MQKLIIKTPSRIHLGFLELDNNSDRLFGSLGLTISNFETQLSLRKSKKTNVICENSNQKEKIKKIITLLNRKIDFPPFELKVLKSIPAHSGLGSGTQLALSIGTLISSFAKKNISIDEQAIIFKRGKRSGIGIESFKNGGFIVDGGKIKKSTKIPPILFNYNWPENWKLILILDKSLEGIHGLKEKQEFRDIKGISGEFSKENCKSLCLKILPAIIEKRFKEFCSGMQEVQNNTARIFSKAQGGFFSSRKISMIFNFIKNNEKICYGQSSWGPTGYIILENESKREKIFNEISIFIKKKFIKDLEMVRIEGKNKGFILK